VVARHHLGQQKQQPVLAALLDQADL